MVEAILPCVHEGPVWTKELSFSDQLLQIFNFYMTEERPFFQNCSSLTRNDCFMAKRILPMMVKLLTLVTHLTGNDG